MSRRMSEEDWAYVEEVQEYDHVEAHMIAEEYTWGWASCWFADTGQFAPPTTHPLDGSYTNLMDRAMFGWWADRSDDDDGRGITARETRARERMRSYMAKREAAGDLGEVEGFNKLWKETGSE